MNIANIHKVANALDAGAVGALIFNEGQPGRTGLVGINCGAGCFIPTLSLTFDLGNEFATLLAAGEVIVRIAVVSEPAPLAILGLGLAALGFLRRRQAC